MNKLCAYLSLLSFQECGNPGFNVIEHPRRDHPIFKYTNNVIPEAEKCRFELYWSVKRTLKPVSHRKDSYRGKNNRFFFTPSSGEKIIWSAELQKELHLKQMQVPLQLSRAIVTSL